VDCIDIAKKVEPCFPKKLWLICVDVGVIMQDLKVDNSGYSWTMVKVLTAIGTIGWASWHYGDWKRVK